MPYWLTNPEHGTMPVYTQSDVDRHAALGWTLLNQGESPEYAKPAAEVLKEALAESMLLDPPPTGKYAFASLPGEGPTTPLTAHVGVSNTIDQADIALQKRKPGRPRKVA